MFPDFVTTAQYGGKVVSLTHRPPLPPGNTLIHTFLFIIKYLNIVSLKLNLTEQLIPNLSEGTRTGNFILNSSSFN
jgi:hypothetical protein